MKKLILPILLVLFGAQVNAQYYFPPKTGNIWDTMSPNELGWCQDSINSLYQFLDDGKTKGFMVLKDGKIVLEQYFNGHGRDSTWYWASAGKTMVSFLIGRAQEQGLLNISDSSSKYLGKGWTSLTPEQEGKITVQHQLTMTSGLDFTKPDCTNPSCLTYWKDAGTGWYYHNPPYTLLRDVLENATGKNINQYMLSELTLKTGIKGQWFFVNPNNLLFSTTRNMAKFGSLMLNNGQWDGAKILGDTQFLGESVTTSQSLNKAYGYLWWLNGKESFRLPGSTLQFNGQIIPEAPADMYAGMGKNGQYVCVIPSQNMVVIRMGDDPDVSLVPTVFINNMFKKISNLSCGSAVPMPAYYQRADLAFYPNPIIKNDAWPTRMYSVKDRRIDIFSSHGQWMKTAWLKAGENALNLSSFARGLYIVKAEDQSFRIQVE
ncbi:beta-lactamase family protein [Bacteroidia bacterium]|nr:beta-lactamase family protein [Bacteroidia bacterium]